MKYKLFFICFLLFNHAQVSGLNFDDYVDESLAGEEELESLYIKNADKIDDLDTVVFYLSNTKPDLLLLDQFKIFSDEIGLNNGAVYIPLKEDASLDSLKQDAAYKYKSKTECRFIFSGNNRIVFSIKDKVEKCFYFSIGNDGGWFSEILGSVIIYIKDTSPEALKKLTKLEVEDQILNTLKTGVEGLDDNKTLIYQQLSKLIQSIKNHF